MGGEREAKTKRWKKTQQRNREKVGKIPKRGSGESLLESSENISQQKKTKDEGDLAIKNFETNNFNFFTTHFYKLTPLKKLTGRIKSKSV